MGNIFSSNRKRKPGCQCHQTLRYIYSPPDFEQPIQPYQRQQSYNSPTQVFHPPNPVITPDQYGLSLRKDGPITLTLGNQIFRFENGEWVVPQQQHSPNNRLLSSPSFDSTKPLLGATGNGSSWERTGDVNPREASFQIRKWRMGIR